MLMHYPQERAVELKKAPGCDGACTWAARLREEPEDADPLTQDPDVKPPWNGYSGDGDVTAKVVYANYGRTEDFAVLEAKGVDVSGCIVIVRYGKIFRGNKVWNAQELGAVGTLIYSDPLDDGFVKGTVYPDGPFRNEWSAQRGSVYIGEGDPLTPGWPSTPGQPRLTLAEARSVNSTHSGWALPSIPPVAVPRNT